MEEGQPSRSAIFAAMSRAAHLILDDEPKILRDNLALGFCGMQDEAELSSAFQALQTQIGQLTTPELAQSFIQSYRGFAVVRQRYPEDELEKALERGISQYVILGAGLDSFSYRSRDLEDKLRVFEVDLPAMQRWKKARLQELNIFLPRNLAFVPVDFEKHNLTEELIAAGYRSEIPVFFSWLGVTHFLTESAIFQTLSEVASTVPGSEIVFDYVLQESLLRNGDRQIIATLRANPGEPWLSLFNPVNLAERVKEIGYSEVWDFGPEEANELYFKGRTDELSPTVLDRLPVNSFRSAHLMKARV